MAKLGFSQHVKRCAKGCHLSQVNGIQQLCKQVSLGHLVTTLRHGIHVNRQISPATCWYWGMVQLQTGLPTLL